MVHPAPNHLVAGNLSLPGDGAALVHRRATPQPELPQDIFPSAQPGALRHRPLPPRPGLLVLHPHRDPRAHALGRRGHRTACALALSRSLALARAAPLPQSRAPHRARRFCRRFHGGASGGGVGASVGGGASASGASASASGASGGASASASASARQRSRISSTRPARGTCMT